MVQKYGSIIVSNGKISDSVNRKMTIVKAGNGIYIRTKWNDNYDLVQSLIHNRDEVGDITDNKAVRFYKQYTIDKDTPYESTVSASEVILFTQGTDDNCPMYINGGYIGANHGFGGIYVATSSTHGKEIADEGSKWEDSASVEYTILRVVDADTLWLISENTISPPSWYTKPVANATTFSHVSGATNTSDFTVATTTTTQWWPALQNKSVRFLIDKQEFTDDGVYQGDNFDIIEGYEIKDIYSTLTYAQSQTGSADHISFDDSSITAIIKMQNTYHYTPNGGCSVLTSFNSIDEIGLLFYGGVQAGLLLTQGGNIYMYIDGLNSYVEGAITYDWTAIHEITDAADVTAHKLSTANLTDANTPSKTYLQYTTDGDGDKVYGLCLGYNPMVGRTQDSIRKNLLTDEFQITTTRKSYPYGIEYASANTWNADSVWDAVAFRCPVNYDLNPFATNISWHEIGNDVYMYIDYHSAFTGYIVCEDYLLNKTVEVIESTGCTIDSDYVTVDGIHITIAGSYGHSILKLSLKNVVSKNKKVAVVDTSTYDVLEADELLEVTYTGTGAVTSITLPTAQCVEGRTITIKDVGSDNKGNCQEYSITLDTEGPGKIEGEDTYVMTSKNGMSITVTANVAKNNWMVN